MRIRIKPFFIATNTPLESVLTIYRIITSALENHYKALGEPLQAFCNNLECAELIERKALSQYEFIAMEHYKQAQTL